MNFSKVLTFILILSAVQLISGKTAHSKPKKPDFIFVDRVRSAHSPKIVTTIRFGKRPVVLRRAPMSIKIFGKKFRCREKDSRIISKFFKNSGLKALACGTGIIGSLAYIEQVYAYENENNVYDQNFSEGIDQESIGMTNHPSELKPGPETVATQSHSLEGSKH